MDRSAEIPVCLSTEGIFRAKYLTGPPKTRALSSPTVIWPPMMARSSFFSSVSALTVGRTLSISTKAPPTTSVSSSYTFHRA